MFNYFRKEIEWGGRKLVLETGKIARQADGAVMVSYGETIVLCTAVGVSNKPNPVPSVGCADACSRKYARPYVVPLSFQVSARLLEDHASVPASEAANVFAHNETRGSFAYDAQHFGPQVALVVLSQSLPCGAVGLARESSADNINSSAPCGSVKLFDIGE